MFHSVFLGASVLGAGGDGGLLVDAAPPGELVEGRPLGCDEERERWVHRRLVVVAVLLSTRHGDSTLLRSLPYTHKHLETVNELMSLRSAQRSHGTEDHIQDTKILVTSTVTGEER